MRTHVGVVFGMDEQCVTSAGCTDCITIKQWRELLQQQQGCCMMCVGSCSKGCQPGWPCVAAAASAPNLKSFCYISRTTRTCGLIGPWIRELSLVCWLQYNQFEGKLAGVVADTVVAHLISIERLPESCRSRDAVDMSRVMLSRPGNLKVVGRDSEVERVMEALTGDAGAAVLVGGPGEGKSTVSMEAGLELCRRGWFPGGAFVVDFIGEREQLAPQPVSARTRGWVAVCVRLALLVASPQRC
jgi:hypothetical protein